MRQFTILEQTRVDLWFSDYQELGMLRDHWFSKNEIFQEGSLTVAMVIKVLLMLRFIQTTKYSKTCGTDQDFMIS
jgi:hypothetical protein